MEGKRNILFLDFDGVLNSNRSFYQKFADHYKVKWEEEDFSIEKWYGKGEMENMNPDLWKRMETAKETLTKKLGYPNLGMYNWPHEEPAIEALNRIVKDNDADAVICSSWRTGKTIEELQEILDGWGFKGKVVGKTPRFDHSQHLTRGKEILNWIMDNRNHINGICILDDDARYDINGILFKWAVQDISGYTHGLREEHIPLAKKCFDTRMDPLTDFTDWVSSDLLEEAKKKDGK